MSRFIEILEQLNALDEHSTLEAKSRLGKSSHKTICAFANEPGLGGGTIFFGVQLNKKLARSAYEVIGIEAPDTGMIDNSLYRQHSDCDTLQASRELKQLCDTGFPCDSASKF
ncbi:MAG: ATP-binding protein [Planctomycetaceae bacterium]|nr:ATP-binding protein [Planctomycetaceae bacterium]